MEVYPGKRLNAMRECLLGHGTYKDKDEEGEEVAVASVSGEIQQIDRLITLVPKHIWYFPYVGDVVVGRVISTANKRWYVDINTKMEAILMLTAINLQGNVQRRKGETDEINMRNYYNPGDIIIAEVHSVGAKIQLHTRNENYKKTGYGMLLKADVNAVTKEKTQFLAVQIEEEKVSLVFGMNGYISVSGTNKHSIKSVAQKLLLNQLEQIRE
ncbi:exosome complex component RRP4 [Nematocida sp. LUAm3]|nr:exosome complex component RRP4 [Nematocida sp. LUAm3]KAI5176106.1 exosome complex component RRP4 [Nematocida sp. LUAm2]KAI5178994.1 exosome complex component RRP4 [Nematocida sp. LUAm1]